MKLPIKLPIKLISKILPIILLGLVAATAAPRDKTRRVPKKSNLETNINFSDLMVQGKYQLADEASAIVEDDKTLNDLLQPRRNFKDRLSQTAQRN